MKGRKAGKIIRDSFLILKKALVNFGSNNPVGMAGTTAYFAIFSIAPILIIIISVFGIFAGDITIRQKLFDEVNVLIGSESSQLLENAIENYQIAENSGIGAVIGGVIFLVSATTLFSIMQNYINYIWRVKVKSKLKQNILKLVKDRIFSFGMILSLGFILLVSLVVDASIAFLRDILSLYFTADFVVFAQVVNVFISLAIITLVFAFIYRFLPDVNIKWRSSWFGAIFTAIFFFIGKYIIGFIIGNSKLGAVYGAASSFVVILIWIYFVSLIFYFGVEITHQYSKFYNHKNKPLNFAIPFEITPVK
ncbi:ribonuclease BN [Maribellus comscasis]|uniref:Ribonuclease BN n=1 Tax=Maribellus comscasis TaxID=2681766 RepID=A0A6I6JX02_9BACT|nr:YihY/virulence factor BrkB family protein [Maribellus comscasis]QGY42294.1 ribonuclease BN [Maribellus comscasis]